MVSILITTYNSASVLKTCLESVLQQDYADREIVIVDNASSDGTRAVLQEFERKCGREHEQKSGGKFETRLRVIYNDTNRGFSGGQNQAIAQARGDWLCSLNPDVILAPDFLSTLLAAAELLAAGLLAAGRGGE